MKNLIELIEKNPDLAGNLTLKFTATDLKDFANYCFEAGKKEIPPPTPPEEEDELLTPNQVTDILNISSVTLWNWDKKGITKPIKIGRSVKRYRKSDLKDILKNNQL